MQLQQLSLLNFRNYRQATIKFFDGIHVLYGENGAGKTSILEAIYYLALTKSFRTTIDRHLINHEETMFRLQGQFQAPHGNVLNVTIAYTKESGKHLTVNQQKPQTFSEYIGEVPIVLLHPADLELSQGSPSYRRRFLDVLLSQSSKLYLHHLIQYTRSLKQRNQILQNPSPDRVLLSSWDENIITHGVEIVRKRKDAVLQLEKLVKKYYRQISQKNDEVTIHYRTTLEGDT
ncbi:MAG: DNA replication and repair protein RecF, partial [Methanobacteriota archaeon]